MKSVIVLVQRLWVLGRVRETFASSARITLALLGVMGVCLIEDQPQAIIPLLLGVIASALAETDDSWRGRLRTQLATLLCFALIIGSVQLTIARPAWFMGVLVAAVFLLTMFGTVGERYRMMTSATLIMSLYAAMATQAHAAAPDSPDPALLLLGGAAWHGLVSIVWAAVFPLLAVEQNLARLYAALGTYLDLKSRMFEPVRGIDLEQRRLDLALHNGRVVEALNAVKESLFNRMWPGRVQPWLIPSLHRFFVAQDLHERASSSHEHYELLADRFFHSDVLYRCERVLAALGRDCLALAGAIQKHGDWVCDGCSTRAVEDMDAAIAFVEQAASSEDAATQRARRSLRALATNLGAMARELAGVFQDEGFRIPADSALQHSHPRTWAEFRERLQAQLSLSSPILRHAIRLSLALTVGYLVMWATRDAYGFWVLLTIVFVCQPFYGTTLKRLTERIVGTVIGLVIGWALLRLFPDALAQSLFTVAAGVLFFMLRVTRYTQATAAITTLVLLAFGQVGDGYGLIVPRLIDTLEGSLIAGLSVWLVLPSWYARRLPHLAAEALRSQAHYLREILEQYGAGKQDHLVYRIARRAAHNADAMLSDALIGALQEPRHVRSNVEAAQRFLVLSHTLLNYLSALGAHRVAHVESMDEERAAAEHVRQVLDGIARCLDAKRDPVDGNTALETTANERVPATLALALESAPRDLPDSLRVLRAQLALALRLLPALHATAQALRIKARHTEPRVATSSVSPCADGSRRPPSAIPD